MSKTFSKETDKYFDVGFSSVFCFIAFSGVSPRWEFKKTTINVLPKIVPKGFSKKTKNPKPMYTRFYFDTLLGVSWCDGSSKNTSKNKSENKPLTHPPTMGVADFCLFAGPLKKWISGTPVVGGWVRG
jgi:hypothetical protein